MSQFMVGFARTDITPCMGIPIAGYYQTRIADGVLDPLEANAIAFASGDSKVLIISVDNCGIKKEFIACLKQKVSERTGIPEEAIVICATHTHTGPCMKADIHGLSDEIKPMDTHKGDGPQKDATDENVSRLDGDIEKETAFQMDGDSADERIAFYRRFLAGKLADAAAFAVNDLKPAKMGWKVGKAPNVAFVRRFRMANGAVRTNPGIGNPDIVSPIGQVDEDVNVLRFDREGGETILFMNFGNHPDVVGGCKISADWPGMARRTVENSLPNVKCIFVNGAQGDVNHVNVNAKDGELNDLSNDFDDVLRGYGHARHIGNVIAGAILQVYDKVNYVDDTKIRIIGKTISVPANKAEQKDLPLARKYNELHTLGRDAEIPYKGMELTTVVAEAQRMLRLEDAPDCFDMDISAIAIGNIAFVTIPGEGFTYIGTKLKESPGWKLVLPCGLANGCEGYFPPKEAYEEGGYEARSSNFKAGVAELIAEEGQRLLSQLQE